ncbi:ABC-2 family transporter protein/ABC transporter, putative [Angomonas deanei]|uniref:ABC-2 family transporter protein/ABC transporter, putative n=1 Tax=Angomonas deanei TaxID=59799 RepID=A0A7G2CWD7_9TRYP|nr:ABC-2 family transporter protein/ABC transporter, putative [Angomonas deanei]
MSTSGFNVSIRLNATALPRTNKPLWSDYVGGVEKDGTEMYILSGFSTLQQTVYDYYVTQVNPIGATIAAPAMTPMPTIKYNEQKFLATVSQLAPLILVLGFLYPVSQMTKRIVVEKELRLREAMLIMGLTETVMYLSWFIIYVVQFALVSLISTILLKVTYVKNSNFGIIFFIFFFFCLSIITLSGLMAAFFTKSRLAALLAPLIYFVLSIPLFAMQDTKGGARIGISFLSPSALAVAFDILFDHELSGGMTGSDLTYFRDDPKMLIVLIIMFVDMVLYLLLMLYFDAVLPKDWGTRRHPLFFIVDPIRYCCRRNKQVEENVEDGRAEDGVFEPIADADDAAIRIVGLRKVFGRGKKKFVAVNNLHWCMREGEISILLGHNGAGKSTTMNMMTGMIQATDGDCYIYGRSIRREMKEARQEIGYCPQHNILWPTMTCREHLWYYAAIKGLRGEEREVAIQSLLKSVDFEEKENYRASDLSGGQKRKLSVGISFVGGSRLIFLDEPTAGMDVGARRHTWGLLRERATSHSILLTTHFMDEADLLGDSVAIMSHGRLQCSGSNLFLKSQLGAGYILTMSVIPHVNRQPIVGMVQQLVPSAEPLGSGAGEVALRLPMSAKSVFPDLLASVESDSAKDLGIKAYSMSATTLEEIFLKIALADENKKKEEEQQPETHDPEAQEGEGNSVWNVNLMTKESALMWSQFKALLLKRFWNSLRDRRTQFFQIICPVVCVLLAMLLMLVKFSEAEPILLNDNLYETDVEVDIGTCTFSYPLSSLWPTPTTPGPPPPRTCRPRC